MKKNIYIISLLCVFFFPKLNAQKLNHVQGELLVRVVEKEDPRAWMEDFRDFAGKPTQLTLVKKVSAPLNIWLYAFDYTIIHEYRFLQAVSKHAFVETVQFNHLVEMRSIIPDDPQFTSQWQYINTGQSGGTPEADLDADLAWDVTTGGLTAFGDTIVVAVLDGGIDLNHQDFGTNLWVNHAEVPGNSIDDDGNGYVDDYRGWSIGVGNDDISGNDHGTGVAGIVGAKGNNAMGVTGVNWDVKLMIIKNDFNTSEAAVLEAFSYPLLQRMRYNASNGAEGAFVVATNGSWGVDEGMPDEAPLWCAFYDTLGTHGILNCGATANEETNVDEEGDLPTLCPSDYLIAVTNVDHNDQKVTSAGYGLTAIDLGAFGKGTWTSKMGNSYGTFGGTSAAAPHVSGAIALLYSAPCPGLMALSNTDPAAAALLVKEAILNGVDSNESLEGITVTGGRLNINNSMQLIMQDCDGCFPASGFAVNALTDVSAMLNWNITDSIVRVDLKWRTVGDANWQLLEDVQSPLSLTGLLACTDYEVQLKTYCASETLDFSESYFFRTDGCCENPAGFTLSNITQTAALASWNSVLAAISYNVRIKAADAEDWSVFNTPQTSIVFNDLGGCTSYEIQVQTVCADRSTEYSSSYDFITLGCGACYDLAYCVPNGIDASYEWIDTIVLNDFVNASGSDSGYGDYTGLESPALETGQTYPLRLIPGYDGTAFNEVFLLWIDYNQNGVFSSSELAFQSTSASGPVEGELMIPSEALEGSTRMRINMAFNNTGSACGFNQDYGEVEDYCVYITHPPQCPHPSGLDTTSVDSTFAVLHWEEVNDSTSYTLRFRKINSDSWTLISSSDTEITLNGLEKCGQYEVQIRSVCSAVPGNYSESLSFTCDCALSIEKQLSGINDFKVMPNPFNANLFIELDLNHSFDQLRLDLITPYGQTLQKETFDRLHKGKHKHAIIADQIAPGFYFIRLSNESGQFVVRKVVKGE